MKHRAYSTQLSCTVGRGCHMLFIQFCKYSLHTAGIAANWCQSQIRAAAYTAGPGSPRPMLTGSWIVGGADCGDPGVAQMAGWSGHE
jgi:hypothetical protein